MRAWPPPIRVITFEAGAVMPGELEQAQLPSSVLRVHVPPVPVSTVAGFARMSEMSESAKFDGESPLVPSGCGALVSLTEASEGSAASSLASGDSLLSAEASAPRAAPSGSVDASSPPEVAVAGEEHAAAAKNA